MGMNAFDGTATTLNSHPYQFTSKWLCGGINLGRFHQFVFIEWGGGGEPVFPKLNIHSLTTLLQVYTH